MDPVRVTSFALAACGTAITLGIGFSWLRYKLSLGDRPMGRKRDFKPYKIDPKEHLTRNGFSPKKVDDMLKGPDGKPGSPIDYIIVGSGMSGLTCGTLLSRLGYKCLILEQHDRAGGCMHVYDDKGFEFDTGLHYIGRGGYQKIFKHLQDPRNPVKWAQMGSKDDGFAYDRIVLPSGRIVDHKAGRPELFDHWKKEFPDEHAAVDKFRKLIKSSKTIMEISTMVKCLEISQMFPFIPALLQKVLRLIFPQCYKSLRDVTAALTDNVDLQMTMMGNFGNYGDDPNTLPFQLFADMFHHYRSGGFYPVGGPESITRSMVPVIQRAGGKVLVKADVKSVVLDPSGHARGVVVQKGQSTTEIRCSRGVISSGGYFNTLSLLPEKLQKREAPKEPWKPSAQHLSIFVGFEGSQEELKLPSCNYWCLIPPDEDFEKLRRDPLGAKKNVAFIGFPSAKDPEYNKRIPGKSVGVCISLVDWEVFEEWKDQKHNKRDGEYITLKREIAEKILNETLFKLHPELKDRLAYFDVGTALSTKYYLRTPKGGSYGQSVGSWRLSDMRLSSREFVVPGLWMTGQDALCPGVFGAWYAGIFTAGQINGYGVLDLANETDLLSDICKHLKPLTPDDFKTL